ncbi:MAG TPA: hypothetical protein VIP46_13600 [Pyrinomonadaceae bacterium]
MNRKRLLLAAAVILAGLALAAAVSDNLLAAPGAQAREAVAPGAGQRWEYCALSKATYAGPPRAGIYWISYFNETGVQVVEVQASATEGSGAAFSKAINRLGAEGWEMVAPGPLEVNQSQSSALYFKRPKQ